MRHNTISVSANGKIRQGFKLPLFVNHPSTTIRRKKDFKDFSNSELSELGKPVIWTHTDSWAEAEFLHPIIKLLTKDGKYAVLMTCSSPLPAGHDLPRDCGHIDILCPLPFSGSANAESFVASAKLSAAIFTLSAHCSNYLHLLRKRNIPAFLFVTKMRKASFFLKWQVSSHRNALKTFTRIFVFDNKAKAFLDKLKVIDNVTADRYPPVAAYGQRTEYGNDCHDLTIERFIADEKFIFIGGNIDTGKDLKLVARLTNANPALKCIFAPRTISEEHLNRIKYELEGFALLYSECDENTTFDKVQILIIDFLGDLSRIYRYGSCAYIGGGFSSCLRNVIAATANGLPTAFGPGIKHSALTEYLTILGVSQIVRTPDDICEWGKRLLSAPALTHRIHSDSIQFVERGAETSYRIYTCINSCL